MILGYMSKMNMGANWLEGGGSLPPPPAPETQMFFGQRAVATPGDGGETGFDQTTPTTAHVVEVGFVNLLANGFLHIRVPTVLEISEIRQLFLGVPGPDILSDWTKTEDYGLINLVSFDSYTRGPINPEAAGQDIEYQLTFVAGA